MQVDVNPDAGPDMRFDLILLSDLIFNHSQVRHHRHDHHHLPPTFRFLE
jgi:predicted nicotinamide N-methyase